MFCLTTIATLFAAATAAPILEKRLAFDYNGNKVYGVNLGGWFVLEPWITPSLFSDGSSKDEYELSKALGGNAQSTLSNHWNSWITQGDFNKIAQAGLNHVRVPVGYCTFGALRNSGGANAVDQGLLTLSLEIPTSKVNSMCSTKRWAGRAPPA